jgi:hypothetical protein
MKTLAFITIGNSEYDDRLWKLLEESGIDPHEFESLDYFSLIPFFVLAGASVRTEAHAHEDHMHFGGVTIELAPEMEEPFFAVLPDLLAQATAE